jgi:hypothetical protein
VPDLTQDTLADLFTLMSHPPRLRRGNTRLAKPPNPAAGAGYTYPVTSDFWERIVSVAFTLTTAAGGAARSVALELTDADGFVFNASPAVSYLGPSSAITCYADLETAVAAPGAASASGEGSVTDPGAAAVIASAGVLQPGIWDVAGEVYLSGTVTAADANNMAVAIAGTNTIDIAYPGQAGVPAAFNGQIELSAAHTVSVNAIAAASGAAAVYNASFTATPSSSAGAQASIPDITLKSGYSLQVAVAGIQAGDQLSGIGILAERYPSNWADGSLAADEESQIRHLARWLAEHGQGL